MYKPLMIGLLLGAVATAAAQERVDVLVLGNRLKEDERLSSELAAQNINLVRRFVAEPLSMEMLRQFQVVVIGDAAEGFEGYILPDHMAKARTVERNLALIQDYVRAGGGLLFSPDLGGQGGAEAQSRFLRDYGAKVLPLQVRDDSHRYVPQPPPNRDAGYAWTTEIADHPATRGVQCIFYPTPQHRWDDFYSTAVMQLTDPAWQVLVRGMDSSSASRCVLYVNWSVVVAAPPPIAAVREFDQGRVGLLAVMSYYTLWHPYWTPEDHSKYQKKWGRGQIGERSTGDIDGIFMEKGDGVRTSQGRELLIGMLRWLGDNARGAGMGGYTAERFAALPVPAMAVAPEWPFKWTAEPKQQNFKILVGARSAWSDGEGTLEEYAAAAKAAGVDVLMMTEDFAAFDPARWNDYYAACQAVSDETLTVYPGLDIADTYGARYLLLNSPVFPQPFMLSDDGKVMREVHYLCLCFPKGITVAHRVTSSPIPHQLIKHFQGISVSTYNRTGELVDNSLPAWEWELFNLSNPMLFAVHEIAAPGDVAVAATTGLQLYAAAPTREDLLWYLGKHGTAHFWASPVHLQVSSGPLLTAFGNQPFLQIESKQPLREVRLYKNYELYRRWLPGGAKTVTVDRVSFPESNVNWSYLTATDAAGNTLIAPGLRHGKQVGHTWRCGDRQNWWVFPNIYTGTDINGFDIRVPVPGSAEATGGSRGFPQNHGPQRGDNLAPLLDFVFAGPAVYIQDVFMDQRYYHAIGDEIVYDAKPAHATTRSRNYRARVRYHQFLEPDMPALPLLKEIEIALRRPVMVHDDIFPVISSLDMKNHRLRGDMRYAYTDPTTGEAVSGQLTKGLIDIPAGGRIGGLIVVSGTLRVGANSVVGFAAPADKFETLPTGTSWAAAFVTVPPEQAERWRELMGYAGSRPYQVTVSRGELRKLDLVADCQVTDYGFAGEVAMPLPVTALTNLVAAHSQERDAANDPLQSYRLPLKIAGVNGNWPAALWRPDGEHQEISVFENHGWARLDITRAGGFYAGNTLLSDVPSLRLALVKWTPDALVFEVNNVSDQAVRANVWTSPAISDRLQGCETLELAPGTSRIVTCNRKKD
ncbi:MAG: hypothetical protein HQ523_05525 [Lentisphaerae bacterium]|nr:hypothetical protein [Lentisphaerota bacterium]